MGILGDAFAAWSANAVLLRAPAVRADLERFEKLNHVAVPRTLRELLVTANGFERSARDDEGFRFLSLEEYGQVMLARATPSTVYAFAEALEWSWAYATDMGRANNGAVYLVGTSVGAPRLVADSVEEFLRLYLARSERIYA